MTRALDQFAVLAETKIAPLPTSTRSAVVESSKEAEKVVLEVPITLTVRYGVKAEARDGKIGAVTDPNMDEIAKAIGTGKLKFASMMSPKFEDAQRAYDFQKKKGK